MVALLLTSRGAPLGEPVAEDFDFLRPALFDRSWHLLDGGGADAYWRPLSFQLYYRALAPLMRSHPGAVAALQALALAFGALLLYRALRPSWPGPAAFAAASFPLLAESTRQMVAWSAVSPDLGLFLFSALALHETSRRRLPGALAAVLAALLCKEPAVLTAAMIPFFPAPGWRWRERRRWAAALAALVLVWGLVSLAVRRHAGLITPQALVAGAEAQGADLLLRLEWALWGSLRAVASLGLAPDRRDAIAAVLLAALALAAGVVLARSAAARARMARALPWIAWGGAWFLAASAILVVLFPNWIPTRSQFGSLGLGIGLAAALAAAQAALPVALVAARLVLLGASPEPPARISEYPPETGSFVDFVRLTRLQRLMRDTRTALRAAHPTLPPGARVVWHYYPRSAQYAFGGSRALRTWYRDSTLQWTSFSVYSVLREPAPAAIVEFQPERSPQAVLVNPAAMRALLDGSDFAGDRRWATAREALDRALALQPDTNAAVFEGMVLSRRSMCLFDLDSLAASERDAWTALRLWNASPDPRYMIANIRFRQGRLAEAEAQLDTLLSAWPDRSATALRERIRAARAAARSGGVVRQGAAPARRP